MGTKSSLFNELKRRNVFRASAAYIALGWVVTQVTATVVPILHLPESVTPIVLWIGVIGFPFLVMFAWIYEITPEGLKRESEVVRDESITHITAKRLDFAVIGLLVLAMALFAFGRMYPQERVAPAAPVAADRPAATPVEAAVSDASIAVLPFNNMSSDKEQDYFSDGISEELLNLLAKIPNLKVAARTSSFSFKGKEVEVPEIARQLHVAHVLEGSVRKSGNQVRITAQLIRADKGYHLWSETYDREFTDIFKLQDEIAGAVVAALKLKLLPGQTPAPTNPTTNTEAYNQYLLGNQYYNRPTAENLRRAAAAYRQAIALDPKFAQAHAALAFAEGYGADWEPTLEAIAAAQQRAIAAAELAVALAPGMAEGYVARGWARRTLSRDWFGAQEDFERALALDPGRAEAQRQYGTLLSALNRTTEGIAALRKATELDPLSARAWSNLGLAHACAGQLDDAEGALNRALAINPESNIALFWLGSVRLLQHRPQDALPIFARAGDLFGLVGAAMAEHALGHAKESQAALAEFIARHADSSAYQIAEVQAFVGEKDKAFEWLERASKQRDPGLAVVKADPLFASLRGDPRYAALLKQLGLPE